ncbi:MAG: class I SAM-dependent methyltransferase [Gammaproteobacteria bacterium]|nr:MAG: class I SAM-dependent methyltransferase [Gammaproteobacteria bacterium]
MTMDTLDTLFRIDSQIHGWNTPDSFDHVHTPQRYAAWQHHAQNTGLQPDEHLLPRILCHCPEDLPGFMQRGRPTPQLAEDVQALDPWDFWFQLAPGITSNNNNVTRNRVVCRSHMISHSIATLLGPRISHSTLLDMGCHSGFFSLDMADRGAGHVTGVELRKENLQQARFLQAHYQLPNIDFIHSDVMEWQPQHPFTVVMNLGLLYHVIDPICLVRKTYEWCTDFAVIDTVCHKEPISAYITAFNKNTEHRGEGRYTAELHPTYRALIDTMHDAGFTDLLEVVGHTGRVAGVYEKRIRRCIIGFKRPLAEILQEHSGFK